MAPTHIPLPHQPGQIAHWGSVSQAGLAYTIAQAVQTCEQTLVVVTPDTAAAIHLEATLRFFLPATNRRTIYPFPDWETLPYDLFSPHQAIVSERLATLYQLPRANQGLLIIPITTLLHRLCPRAFLESSSLMLHQGDTLSLTACRQQLEQAGYRCVDTVYEHGEFAVRGALIDIFPMGSTVPYRIDLLDDEIDTLRVFNPDNQQTVAPIAAIELLPGHEFPMDETACSHFRARFREQFDVDHRACPVYQDVKAGLASPGIEYYLPLFFEHTATLFDYLPDNTCLLLSEHLSGTMERFLKDVEQRYHNRKVDPIRPLLPPTQLFMRLDECNSLFKTYPRIMLSSEPVAATKAGCYNLSQRPVPDLTFDAKADQPMGALLDYLPKAERTLFIAESAGRREVLLDMLKDSGITPKPCADWSDFLQQPSRCGITVGALEQPLHLDDAGIALIPEAHLLGQRVVPQRQRQGTGQSADQIVRNLTELRLGAPVVHIDHGVGRYHGLQTLAVDGQLEEFLTLEYANAAKLYVPVSSLHLIARYTGANDDTAPLHRLGSEQWSKVRRKAAGNARDVAAELLDIYARREARTGHTFTVPEKDYLTFAADFPFEATPDQQQAIDAVIHDMTAITPMDRLICGDVGFGKTEVAMRAAFIAVQNSKQVAILVPTTLLAQQHYDSFQDRFADWPVTIDVLSRFRTQKAATALKPRLANGQIDIIIGTHKLLQTGLAFKDLGLLIVDEEHRFGVRHKEKIKSLRAEVDMLTLTATPIPRTLNTAMAGIRDLSIIATPPARRLSVKTFVRPHDTALIKEAVLRELLRGGQVYYLHNDVQTIEKTAQQLREWLPEARIAVGHGQMRERDLEQVMSDFYHKRFNLLVCTTIIETGIDIPSANTIIIHRADTFGLAQLHQLRGRVGRSHHQAYAYLLTPPAKAITANAVKRLEAISEAHDLGAGFMLASHDLEIRGAGELLGEGQSGHMHSVGFTLYTELLEQAVAAIQKGETPNLDQPLCQGTEINLRLPALLPETYIHDVHHRLVLYKRIAAAATDSDLQALQIELIDRFGLLPEAANNLFRQTQLKLTAQALGIKKMDAGTAGGRIEFTPAANVNPAVLIQLVQAQPKTFQLAGEQVLKYHESLTTHEQRFQFVENLLKKLAA